MTFPKVEPGDIRDLRLPSAARGLDISNDGKLLAIAHGSGKHTVTLVETQTAKTIFQGGPKAQRAWAVALTEQESALHFLTWDENNQATLWRTPLKSLKTKAIRQYSASERVRHLARDRSGRFLAVIGNQIQVWNLEAGRAVALITGANPDWVLQACFASQSPHLYVYGLESGVVSLCDPRSEEVLQRWDAPGDIGEQVTVSGDGRFLVACGRSYTGVALHDTHLSQQILADTDGIQEFHSTTCGRSFAFSFDSQYLVLVRGRVHLFQLPQVSWLDPGASIHEVGTRATCSASAAEAPVLAFGLEEEKRVLWFRIPNLSSAREEADR